MKTLFSTLMIVFGVAINSTAGTPADTAEPASFIPSHITVIKKNGLNHEIDRHIYTEIAQSRKNAPVILLLNGLIYDITRWDKVAYALVEKGFTVIRMSFSAQPESLLLNATNEPPVFMSKGLSLATLAEDVLLTLNHHDIQSPVTLVGLSYGAAPATEFAKLHPDRVQDLVLLSPLVVPLDNYNFAGQPVRAFLDGIRFWESTSCMAYGWLNPWLCSQSEYWYDSFYNLIYQNFLFAQITSTPSGLDPTLYKKSVFHLVRAVRDYDLRTEASLLRNVHIAIASEDEPNLKQDQKRTWRALPLKEKKSFTEFVGVHHALPDEAPEATSRLLETIANRDTSHQDGAEFIVK
ncbi:MAG: alpha/beta hydrolase [Bdellovibrionales bacterium]|jgi:pimeloyl-ACP methyl ester carboxylesterase|nr:alpha/beta hydrolase [Bdellovibrionales bacterium]